MKNTNNIVKAYAVFSQGIITILVLMGLGFFIGWRINKKSLLCGILAVVGLILGVIVFFINLYNAGYIGSKHKIKRSEDDEEK